jgi:hypothetical protein
MTKEYTKFEDMDLDDQIDLLHQAVKELQSRFNSHKHDATTGDSVVATCCLDEVNLHGAHN